MFNEHLPGYMYVHSHRCNHRETTYLPFVQHKQYNIVASWFPIFFNGMRRILALLYFSIRLKLQGELQSIKMLVLAGEHV